MLFIHELFLPNNTEKGGNKFNYSSENNEYLLAFVKQDLRPINYVVSNLTKANNSL